MALRQPPLDHLDCRAVLAQVLHKRESTEEIHKDEPSVTIKVKKVAPKKLHGIGCQIMFLHWGLLRIHPLILLTDDTFLASLSHL